MPKKHRESRPRQLTIYLYALNNNDDDRLVIVTSHHMIIMIIITINYNITASWIYCLFI